MARRTVRKRHLQWHIAWLKRGRCAAAADDTSKYQQAKCLGHRRHKRTQMYTPTALTTAALPHSTITCATRSGLS